MATTAQDGLVQAQPVKKKRWSARGFVNSPWALVGAILLAVLVVGGIYLINHLEYIVEAAKYPYAVAFLVGIIPVIFVSKLIINFFSVIEQWIRLQFEKARGSKKGFFFELVICVFMFVSICEAGPFFNDIQHNMLSGALGYITVLAFDLIAVVCIDSRRKELAKGGTKAGVYLLGVIICALVSMTANLYSALQNFHTPVDPTIPGFLKMIAPYVGIMFPVMIVFLAFSRDADIEIDDAEAYRKQQQKRVDFLVVRREILAKVTHEMEQINLLGKREFVLKSLFFTRKKMNLVVEIVGVQVKSVLQTETAALQKALAEKEWTISHYVQEMTHIRDEVAGGYDTLKASFAQEIQTLKNDLAEKERVINSQFEAMNLLVIQVQNQQEVIANQVAQLATYQTQITSLDHAKIAQEVTRFLPEPEAINHSQIAREVMQLLPQQEAINHQQLAQELVPFLPKSEPINYQKIASEIIPLLPVQKIMTSEQNTGEIQAVSSQKTGRITQELGGNSFQQSSGPTSSESVRVFTGYTEEQIVDDTRVIVLFKRIDTRRKVVHEAIESGALPLRKGLVTETGLSNWIKAASREKAKVNA